MGNNAGSKLTNNTTIMNKTETNILNENDVSTVINNIIKNNNECSSIAKNTADIDFGTVIGDFNISGNVID